MLTKKLNLYQVPLSVTSLPTHNLDRCALVTNRPNSEWFGVADAGEERLRFLNQEIANLRDALDGLDDWDLYESAPLKYQIMAYEDERARMARDCDQRRHREERAKDESRRRVDVLRDEIDWVERKMAELRMDMRGASRRDRREVRKLSHCYEQYWRQLMTDSGRRPRASLDAAEARVAGAAGIDSLEFENMGRRRVGPGAAAKLRRPGHGAVPRVSRSRNGRGGKRKTRKPTKSGPADLSLKLALGRLHLLYRAARLR